MSEAILKMTNQTKTEKLEPIPREAYECPICEHEMVCSLEEAREHIDQPVDTLLPKGLVVREGDRYFIIVECGNKPNKYFTTTHGLSYTRRSIPESGYVDGYGNDTKQFKSGLGKIHTLLSKKEFEAFKEKYEKYIGNDEERRESNFEGLRVEELIRTTPELEAILEDAILVAQEEASNPQKE